MAKKLEKLFSKVFKYKRAILLSVCIIILIIAAFFLIKLAAPSIGTIASILFIGLLCGGLCKR